MEGNEQVQGSRRFGTYLRTIRESRKLSLDAVEEMTGSCAERVTKSHLSRIENGLAVPTFPRLLALGQIYGVPIGSLAERFEMELRRDQSPVDLANRTDTAVLEEAKGLQQCGRYSDALMLLLAIWDRRDSNKTSPSIDEDSVVVRLNIINCLIHMRRFETAKQHCEQILAHQTLRHDHRLLALHYFVVGCAKLGRYSIAQMALDQAEHLLADHGVSGSGRDFAADFALVRGNVSAALGDSDKAAASYEEALRRYTSANNAFEACRTRVLLGKVYGTLERRSEAEDLLRFAHRDAEKGGYDRFSSLALHHLGLIAFRAGEYQPASGYFLRSNSLARSRDFVTLVFGNCYYLWRIARESADEPSARAHFRSLRSLIGRVEEALPEVEEFRAKLARGES